MEEIVGALYADPDHLRNRQRLEPQLSRDRTLTPSDAGFAGWACDTCWKAAYAGRASEFASPFS